MNRLVAICAAAVAACGMRLTATADDAYVASTSGGNQFINTGYRVKSNTKLEVDFKIDTVANGKYVFGANGGSGTTCALWVNGSGNLEPNFGGWCNNIGGAATTTRRTIVYDLPDLSITLYEHGSDTPVATKDASKINDNGAATLPIVLFGNCMSADGAGGNFMVCRIYSFKVWEKTGGTYALVHSWTPARKGDAVGFADEVDGSFIGQTSPGGSLVLSGDCAALDDGDEPFIESDGTTVVNSGVKPSPDLRVELDYALTSTAPKQRPLGSYGSGQTVDFYVNDAGDGIAYCVAKGWKSQYVAGADTRRHTFIADVPADKCYLVTDGATNFTASAKAGGDAIDAEGSYPIGLFGRIVNSNGANDWDAGRAKARIYGVRFFRNGVLFKNLVPRVKGDVPGFLDTVSGRFLTGEFNVQGLSASAATPRIHDDGFIELAGNDQTKANALKGGHFIDTGYTPGPNTRVELDFAFAANRQPGVGGDWYALSAQNSDGTSMFGVYQNAGSFGACLGAGRWKATTLPAATNAMHVRRTFVLDSPNKAVTVRTAGYANFGDTNNLYTAATAMSTTMKLGSTTGGGGGYAPMRIYGLKIYESGTLVREYVPFVKNGAPGLKYGDTFVKVLWNADYGAAGMPRAGGDITVSAVRDRDAFALFSGAQSVDTGYKPNPGTKIVADFAFANAHNKKQQFVFEATGNGTCRFYTASDKGTDATYRYIFSQTWSVDGIDSIACDHQRRLVTIDAPNGQMRFSPGATDGSTYNGDATIAGWTKPSCSGTLKIASNSAGTDNYARIRLYRFTIYDSGAKVRDYVPYAAGGITGLYDTVAKAVIPVSGLEVSGLGRNGAEEWIAAPQSGYITKSIGTKVLSYKAVGAQSYRWTKNGKAIAEGADGNLTVTWVKGGATDAYTVTPVYSVFGDEVFGATVPFTFENKPQGMMILID